MSDAPGAQHLSGRGADAAGGGPRSLVEQLTLEPWSEGRFRWAGVAERRVFGGMLVAHGLAAAAATVDPSRRPHSLHASFVGAADGRRDLTYDVEATRDGGSFSARRVVASHGDGRAVFVLTASFQAAEDGMRYEGPAAPGVPGPDGLDEGRYAGPWFDSRDVPVDPAHGEHVRLAWFRSRQPLPDDPLLHLIALAYLSDHGPTRAVRQPHADHPGVEQRMSVSLDHSVWFHADGRVDDWVLSELRPLATGAGRGLALGSLRTADGTLLATVAQEALLRLPGGEGG